MVMGMFSKCCARALGTVLAMLAASGGFMALHAQPGRTTLLAEHLRTPRWTVDGDATKLPIIQLGTHQQLEFSFDDLTHEYRRYTFNIMHCDYLGNQTEDLFESDYTSNAEADEVIDDYQPSQNTTVLYNHYSLSIPNQRVRPLKSGNYKLVVKAEGEDGEEYTVAESCFCVVDPQLRLTASCTTNTDIDWNAEHQQLTVTADLGTLPLRDAQNEFHIVVLQNGRYDNAVIAPRPTSQSAQVLRWEHCRDLIFEAGNEYRKMEFLSTRYPGMHGESMQWLEGYYNYALFADAPRRNYLYDEDQDGISVIRSQDTTDPDVEADYALTHFSLEALPLADRDVYVHGRWAAGGFCPTYKMTYNEVSEAYEASILLKQGYYNYLYLTTEKGGKGKGSTAFAEGNWFQTENEYTFLSYYRPSGTRYWQMIGATTLKYIRR